MEKALKIAFIEIFLRQKTPRHVATFNTLYSAWIGLHRVRNELQAFISQTFRENCR